MTVDINIELDATKRGTETTKLEQDLKRLVVGQDHAAAEILDMYEMFMAGMSPAGRPVGNFLFLGPTGVGKTRIVEAVAESLVGDPRAIIKVDCAEFQHSHEIAKLIGSPPGYLGHRETHPLLSQEVLNQYLTEKIKISFVLFDEIEKASDALWKLMLAILDKATLTLGDNRRVDFSNTMIFMTSNLGAREMNDRPDATHDERSMIGIREAKSHFSPEFMNRLDKTIVFKPLGLLELDSILNLELAALQRVIFGSAKILMSFAFNVTDQARDYILKEGTSPEYGARHLKRAVNRLIGQPLAKLITTDQIKSGDIVKIDHTLGTARLRFYRTDKDLDTLQLQSRADTDSAQQARDRRKRLIAASAKAASAGYNRHLN